MALTRILHLVALLILGLLLAAAPAAAHTVLVGTEPEADATVDEELPVVALIFSEAVDQQIAEVEVLAPGGASVEDGAAVIDGERVEQAVADLPETGTYTVSFRVVASDGHPLTGEFSFRYDGPVASDDPEDLAEPSAQPTTTSPHDPGDEPTPREGEPGHDAAAPGTPADVPPPADPADAAAETAPTTMPAGLGALAGALLLAFGGASAFAIRGLVRWQPPES